MKSVNCSKPGYTSITCSKNEHIPYNLIFATKCNDSLILIIIISLDYLNLFVANEYISDVTIPIRVIKYNQCCSRWISQLDCSINIKLFTFIVTFRNFSATCFMLTMGGGGGGGVGVGYNELIGKNLCHE